jgi:hypothetical protein
MAKAPIVSKAELDASDYTNLRDYLNAKRGLTRKGGAGPEYKPGREGKDADLGDKMSAAESNAAAERFGNKRAALSTTVDASAGMMSPDMDAAMRRGYADLPAQADKPKAEPSFAEKYLGRPDKESRMAMRERAPKVVQKAMDAVGLKKGGVVSSASKRADGCATKGKTKGRFV